MLLAVTVGIIIGVLTGLILLLVLAFCRHRYVHCCSASYANRLYAYGTFMSNIFRFSNTIIPFYPSMHVAASSAENDDVTHKIFNTYLLISLSNFMKTLASLAGLNTVFVGVAFCFGPPCMLMCHVTIILCWDVALRCWRHRHRVRRRTTATNSPLFNMAELPAITAWRHTRAPDIEAIRTLSRRIKDGRHPTPPNRQPPPPPFVRFDPFPVRHVSKMAAALASVRWTPPATTVCAVRQLYAPSLSRSAAADDRRFIPLPITSPRLVT